MSADDRTRVLFVDDERYVLDGLRDALRARRHEWEMTFVESGAAALSVLEHRPQHVVVSDMRMPGMDGAALLRRVQEIEPSTVRIVLSGHSDREAITRAALVAHRFLAKPCAVEELARIVERSRALQAMAERVELHRAACGASALPSVPRAYRELKLVLAGPDATVAGAAAVVERDMGMAAKVLQLANSACFGSEDGVSDVGEAARGLGLDTIESLVLSASAFDEFDVDPSIAGYFLESIQRHSTRVAHLAHEIARPGLREEAFAAGLLHDIGLLVVAVHDQAAIVEMIEIARADHRAICEVELERHGIAHSEIGGHLLAMWGLPHAVVEAVSHHHDPCSVPAPAFDCVAAVYAADVLVSQREQATAEHPLHVPALDLHYLEQIGVAECVPAWSELADRVMKDH